ncbi:MAG: hypothetical protein B6D39_04560 [Anaerolineae bacterium UTCFX2]|jgi:hypothetical protein|nr:MAG: hypothetical protein B6D39_04560 [Anaerolineae bacterium UTCFX2]
MKKSVSILMVILFVSTAFISPANIKAVQAVTNESETAEYAHQPERLAPDVDNVGLYEAYEITFTISSNIPPTDAAKTSLLFDVIFTSPGNRRIWMPGFWAGGNTWKVRFAPTELGTWHWVTFSTNPSLDARTGSLVSVPSDNKGFIRVAENNPYTFSYSDGTPFFMWGNTAYQLLEQALEGPGVSYEYFNPEDPSISHILTTQDWREFVDKTQEHGMNKIRFQATMWGWGNNYGTRWFPWENSTVLNPQFAVFNQSYWETLDEVVQYMQEKGMVAEIVIISDYSNWEPTDPGMYYMTPADEQLLLRFTAARYAAYSNVIWQVAQEFYYTERVRYGGRVPEAWGREVGSYLAGVDPYRTVAGRLLTIHNRTKMLFSFPNDPWPTHFAIQVGTRITPKWKYENHPSLWGNDSIRYNWGYYKPIANDEYGYADNYELSRAMVRQAAWGIAVGGGYGTYGEWNTDPTWDPYWIKTGGLLGVWVDDPSQEDIKVMTDFMNSLDFPSMSPNNFLITAKPADVYAYMLADEGNTYVMYAAEGSGGQFTLNLKKGVYDAAWIDTTTGDVVQAEPSFELAQNGSVNFESPDYDDDILLVIKAVKFDNKIYLPLMAH